MRLTLLAAAGAGAMTLSSCSGSVQVGNPTPPTSYNETRLLQEIGDRVQELAGGTKPAIACPDGPPAAVGSSVICTVTWGSQVLQVEVTGEEGGNVNLEQIQAILDLDKLQTGVAQGMDEQLGGSWVISCAPKGSARIYVGAPGTSLTCQAGNGTEQSDIKVTIKDLDGNVSWALL